MQEILKTIILDFQELELETGIQRQLQIEHLSGKATVCIGVRRSGKSTYMMQIIQKLLNEGVSKDNIVYINFFDDRLHNLQQKGLGEILDAYYSLYPQKKNSEKVFFFFDEIQSVIGWESFVERLQRTEKCEIYITGSSAHLLSKEIATQMRGRALSWEIFPFSFPEYLSYKSIKLTQHLSTKNKLIVKNAFEEYWESGGFPEVLGLSKNLRIKIHQEYLHAILFRDLIERYDISHPKALSDLTHKLLDNISSFYSINNLSNHLRSLGSKITKEVVSDYIKWIEDAYLLFSVRLFDASITRSNANPKKIYCIDHSFIKSTSSGILLNSGHLLENLVFTTLRRTYPDIYYYKTKNRREVDFITQSQDRSLKLYQSCETLADPQTRKREVSALVEAMKELNLKSGIIITRNEEEQISDGDLIINVIPIWHFLLDYPI